MCDFSSNVPSNLHSTKIELCNHITNLWVTFICPSRTEIECKLWPHFEASCIPIIEDSELICYRFVFFNYVCTCIEKNKYKLPEVCFHLGLHKQIHYMKAHASTCEWWKNTSSQTLVCLEDMILENPVWYKAQFYPGGHKRVSLLVPNTDGSWQALGLL